MQKVKSKKSQISWILKMRNLEQALEQWENLEVTNTCNLALPRHSFKV